MSKVVNFKINLLINGREHTFEASASVKELAKEMSKVQTEAQKTRDALLKLTQTAASLQFAVTGIQQVAGVMRTYTDASKAQQEADRQLTVNMRNTMSARDDEIESIKQLCSEQQRLGIVSTEVQMAGAQELATYLTKKETLETLIPVMNDMIAQQYGFSATQESAANIATMLGKVMDGQTGALSRYGYKFDEAQAQILKFGTEEERVAVLTRVITSSIGGMNEELGKTDAGKIKKTSNAITDVKAKIGDLASRLEPALSVAGELGQTLAGIGTAVKGIEGVAAAFRAMAGSEVLAKAKTVLLAKAQAPLNAIMAIQIGLIKIKRKELHYYRISATAAGHATKALRIALNGLLGATAIGLLFVALAAAVSIFTKKMRQAADSLGEFDTEAKRAKAVAERLEEVESAVADAYTNASAALNIYQRELRLLLDAKATGKNVSTEEKKIVGELNDAYGETMGYFSDMESWYKALIANSEAYCRQMVAEARARTLANQIAEMEAKRHNLLYDETGQPRVLSTVRKKEKRLKPDATDRSGYYAPDALYAFPNKSEYEWVELPGTSELEIVNAEIAGIDEMRTSLEKQLQTAIEESASIAMSVVGSAMRDDSTGGAGSREYSLIENAQTYKDLANNVSYYQQELERADIADTERILTLARAKKAAEDAVQAFKDMTDVVDDTDLNTLDDYDRAIKQLQSARNKASADAIAGLDMEIQSLEERRQALADSTVASLSDDEIRTFDQLNAKLEYYNRLLNKADAEQRITIQNGIDQLNELKEGWGRALEALRLPTATDTLSDIDAAIAFYTARQQREDADQIQRTQEVINDLTEKRRVLQIGIEIETKKGALQELDGLSGRGRLLKVASMGLDSDIMDLESILSNATHPVTDSQRKEIEELIQAYKDLQIQSALSFETLKTGWGSVKGLTDGIKTMDEILDDDIESWEKLTSLVDAFIQTVDSASVLVGGLTKFIDMLTAATSAATTATQAQTAAKAAEGAVTQAAAATHLESAAATSADAAASTAATAAKSGEAVAGAVAAGASIPFPYNLLAIAAGIAAVLAALSVAQQFAAGGIVGGNSPTGDKVLARVNSGEMILNRRQQLRLFQLLNSGALVPNIQMPQTQPPTIELNVDHLRSQLQPVDLNLTLSSRIRGRDLVQVLDVENNHLKRS